MNWKCMIYVQTPEQHKKAQLYFLNKGYCFYEGEKNLKRNFFKEKSFVYAIRSNNSIIYYGIMESFEELKKNYCSEQYLDFSKNTTLMETE